MKHPNIPFLRSVGMMIGAIVGVGVFGLPYAFSQSGFPLGIIELIVVGGMLVIMQLMFAEVAVQTPGQHRIVSYVEIYVGKFWSRIMMGAMSFGVWGAMIAYMIVGGEFLRILFEPLFTLDTTFYSLLIGGVASALIFGGLKVASKIEVIIVAVLLFLFAFIILASLPHVEFANLNTINMADWFTPYGVILFSMAGIGIVPEIKDVLGKKHKREIGRVIVVSMSIIGLLYALFAFAVVGVTGPETSQTAFEALVPVLGDTFRVLATLLGAITIVSIYMMLGIQLTNTLKFDFHLPHTMSWLITCGVPIGLFLFGVREFIDVIGFVGGVFVGIMGMLIALTYWRMRRSPICRSHHCLNFPAPLTWTLILIFLLGIVYEVSSFFV
jgi:amino acid permease